MVWAFRKEINTEQRFGRIKCIKCYPEYHESTPLQLDMNKPTGDTNGCPFGIFRPSFTYYSGAQKNTRGLRRVCVFSFLCYVLQSVDFLFLVCLFDQTGVCFFSIYDFLFLHFVSAVAFSFNLQLSVLILLIIIAANKWHHLSTELCFESQQE